VSDLLGVDCPIVQAPMGYIARAQLASAVSNAGGLGIIEEPVAGCRAASARLAQAAAGRGNVEPC